MTSAKGRPKGSKSYAKYCYDSTKCMIDYVKLRNARKELGLSIGRAATLCKVSLATMSLWEQGLDDPTYEELVMLEKMFGFEPDELVYGGNASSRIKKRKAWAEMLANMNIKCVITPE